jgi:hypothetical protein
VAAAAAETGVRSTSTAPYIPPFAIIHIRLAIEMADLGMESDRGIGEARRRSLAVGSEIPELTIPAAYFGHHVSRGGRIKNGLLTSWRLVATRWYTQSTLLVVSQKICGFNWT